MRKAALNIIVDRIANVRDRRSVDDLKRLMMMSENDSDPTIRIFIPYQLAVTPPFTTLNKQASILSPFLYQCLAMTSAAVILAIPAMLLRKFGD